MRSPVKFRGPWGNVSFNILIFTILVNGLEITVADSFKTIGGIPSMPTDFFAFKDFNICSTSFSVTGVKLKDEMLKIYNTGVINVV